MNDQAQTGRDSAPSGAERAALGSNTEFVFSAAKSVEKYYLLHLAQELLPAERIRICMAHLLPKKFGVELNYNHEHKYAWLSNLQRCGCSWVCAFCATRKGEQDRAEIQYAVTMNLYRYIPLLVTFTMGHHKGDTLEYLLNGLLSAYRAMQQVRGWKLLVEEYCLVGTIRALEINYNPVNGWHPHLHVLWLIEREPFTSIKPTGENEVSDTEWFAEIARSLRNQLSTHCWRPALVALGHYATDERGISVTVGHDDLIAYVEKHGVLPRNISDDTWGIESEMTRRASKKAANEGLGMWDLLRAYGDGDKRSGVLFREYAIATKGKNPLRWSPNLREKLGVKDVPEIEVIYAEPEIDNMLCYLDSDHWKVVRQNRAQGKLIKIASEGDVLAVFRFLNDLPGMKAVGEWWIPKGPKT